MNFDHSDEQVMLVDAMSKAFLAPGDATASEADPARSAALVRWKRFGDLGLFDLSLDGVAGEFGSLIDWALVQEAAGEALVLEPLIASALVGRELLAASDSAQAHDLSRQVANGDLIVAICPATLAAGGATIRATRDGDDWRIHAKTCLVLGAGLADQLLLVAEDPETKKPALFSVAAGAMDPAGRSHLIDGSWGSQVSLGNAPAAYLGAIDAGALERLLLIGRLATCAELVGVMTGAIAVVAPYLQTRVQFDKPLAQHQALQHHLADMAVMADLARSYLHLGLAEYQMGSAAEAAETVGEIYRVVGETAISACERAVQLHGGMGMTEEHVIGRHLKRVMVLAAQFGDL